MKTAEFGHPASSLPLPGKCRICGCTEDRACAVEVPGHGMQSERACGWADQTRTLCDNPTCITAAKRELGIVA